MTCVPAATDVELAVNDVMCGAAPVGTLAAVYTVDICTTSKSEAVTDPRLCRSSLSQRESGAPPIYIDDPLSAMMIPYFLNAFRITWFAGENPEMLKLAFSRSFMPIGAASELLELAAQCDAGGMNAARLCCNVKRIA